MTNDTTKQVTTMEQALELPFTQYMAWCNEWCKNRGKTEPMLEQVYTYAHTVLEAGWARRYWVHHCEKLGNP